MIALLQRVSRGKVTVGGVITGEIGKGLVILLGVYKDDTEKEVDLLAEKTVNIRIFSDSNDKMNQSLLDVGGAALVVSQFTLCADYRKGRRPSYLNAAEPEEAKALYEMYGEKIKSYGVDVQFGEFGAMMDVELVNDGPVTIALDSEIFAKPRR